MRPLESTLYDIAQAVTVFGSARFDENHRYYTLSHELGRELAHHGYAVVTGGGPGHHGGRESRRA